MDRQTRIPRHIQLILKSHTLPNLRLNDLILSMTLGPALDRPADQTIGRREQRAARSPGTADGSACGVFVRAEGDMVARPSALVVVEAVGRGEVLVGCCLCNGEGGMKMRRGKGRGWEEGEDLQCGLGWVAVAFFEGGTVLGGICFDRSGGAESSEGSDEE